MKLLAFLVLITFARPTVAQSPAGDLPAARLPLVYYTLHIDSSDLSGYSVSIRITHAPQHFRLAMATHHEYDDRYWRYVTAFRVAPPASFTREDSAVWMISAPGEEAVVSYRIQLPPPGPYHFAHRPFLRATGGLVGDLHSFMYLVDDPHAACRLLLELPAGWRAESGLDVVPALRKASSGKSHFPYELSADSAAELLDAPILVGRLHRWDFIVRGITHSIVYLPAAAGRSIDSIKLITNIYNIVSATRLFLQAFPYRRYSFLLEDSSEGALEHHNSVTVGIAPGALSSPHSYIPEEIAHEYFHTWNLMAIRPAPYTDLNYGPQQASPGLWFSEGVTMFYADLICRRTHLPVDDSTRIAHLSSLITRYYGDTGNSVLPPSRVSLASNMQPGPLGDYDASTHLQGELLGACLDLLIRDTTDGRQSLDDVMRLLYERFGGAQFPPDGQPVPPGNHRPLHDTDIQSAVAEVCHGDAAHAFFQSCVYEGHPIDFNPWLHLVGLRLQHEQVAATGKDGRPLADTRVYPWILRDDGSLRIAITNPYGCWGLAGLHTGDIIASINGRPMHTRQDFQSLLAEVRVGDTLVVETGKGAESPQFTVHITGYTTPLVHITQAPGATPKQRRLLQQWLDAK